MHLVAFRCVYTQGAQKGAHACELKLAGKPAPPWDNWNEWGELFPVEPDCKEKQRASSSQIQMIAQLRGLLLVGLWIAQSVSLSSPMLLRPDGNKSEGGWQIDKVKKIWLCLSLQEGNVPNFRSRFPFQSSALWSLNHVFGTQVELTRPPWTLPPSESSDTLPDHSFCLPPYLSLNHYLRLLRPLV